MQASVPTMSTVSSSVASRMRDDATSLINDERLYGVFGRKYGQDTHTARSQTPLPFDQDCSIELLCHIKVRGEANMNLNICNQSSPLVAKWRGVFFSTPQSYDICLFVVVLQREIGKTDWHEVGRTEVIENLPANVKDLSFLRVIQTTFNQSRQTELRFELWNSSFFGKKDHERIWTEEKLRGVINADPLANMNNSIWKKLKRQQEQAKKCSKGMLMQKSEDDTGNFIEAKLAEALDGSNMVSERRQEVAAYFESDLPDLNTTIRLPQGILIAYSTCLLSDIMFARTKRIVPLDMKSVLDRSTSICTLLAEGRSRIAQAQYVQFEIQGHDFISPDSVIFHQAPNIFFMLFSEIDKKVTLQYVSELRPKSYSTRWWPFTMCIDRLISDSIYEHSVPRLYAKVMHKPKTIFIKGVRQLDSARALSTFDIDLKKITTNEGELLHLFSRETISGVPIDGDRSYMTLNAQVKETMQKLAAAGASNSELKDQLEQRAQKLHKNIEKSIQDGSSASISVRMLRKKNMSGNQKPRTFKDRSTENDGTMLQELSELMWLDSTYTEQVRKALNFLNEQENYWNRRTYFDEKEHASKFFIKSPQNSPRVCPQSIHKSHQNFSSRQRTVHQSILTGTDQSIPTGTISPGKIVPSLKLGSAALQSELNAALSGGTPQFHHSGSDSARTAESPLRSAANSGANEGIPKAFSWLHRVSAAASSRITWNRVISGTLEEHGSPFKSSLWPKVSPVSAVGRIQTPREQILATRSIASYLANKCGIDVFPRGKAADAMAEFNAETFRSNAATEADALKPQPPNTGKTNHQGHSPLQQHRQRSRID